MKAKVTSAPIRGAALLLLLSTLNPQLPTLHAQGTEFTYSGRLTDNGIHITGMVELEATLWDAATNGNQINPFAHRFPLLVEVDKGLFTVVLDFGRDAFPGPSRWLQLGVRRNPDPEPFTTLWPRQKIAAVPYAMTAANLTGQVPSEGLFGGYSNPVSFENAANVFAGHGSGLDNLNASQLTSGTVPEAALGNAWKIGGNAGTTPGTHFFGTTDNQPLEVRVNNTPVARFGTDESIMLGGPGNRILGAVGSSTIGGGDFNTNSSSLSIIGGGSENSIESLANLSFIGGGWRNVVHTTSDQSAIAGGNSNKIRSGARDSFIGGGFANTIGTGGIGAFIGGGAHNTNSGNHSFIGGGDNNNIAPNSSVATIAGGYFNDIGTNSYYSAVGGGFDNTIAANAPYAAIPGGDRNFATNRAFAAGTRAKANHSGAFVWADSQNTDFASTSSNQFAVRAGGGARFVTGGAGITLDGQPVVSGMVTAGQLADGAVTSAKLAAGAVGSNQLAAGAVMNTNLADGAVTASKMFTVPSSNWVALTILPPPQAGVAGAFGSSVTAMGSDRVLVGAPYVQGGLFPTGAAYLLSTNGTLLTAFSNPTPQSLEEFGASAAAVGTDRVLIGAPHDFISGGAAGAAYLFSTNGTLLTTFTNPTPAIDDFFGASVAAVGSDRVLIGAHQDNLGSGAAYLFSTNSTWGTLLTTFTNPTPGNSFFGSAVAALGNDRVLIGASRDNTGAPRSGAAYLFRTNGTLLMTFLNPTPDDSDEFGSAVAALGSDRVLIGAHYGGTNYAGEAYLFSTNGTLLMTFFNPTPEHTSEFGSAVATVGSNWLLIGAPWDAGAAYLFSTNGTLLTTFTNQLPTSLDQFGWSVAALGNRVLIGAPGDNTGGAVYPFSFGSTGNSYVPGLISAGVANHSITAASFDDSLGLFWDNGNIGIGTNAPTERLSVAGNITATGIIIGNGAGLYGLNASQLTSGTVPAAALGNAWKLGGNAGTTPGAHFLGTTDNQPLELKVNGARGWRLEPGSTPNVVGGDSGNTVSSGVIGAVIAGGRGHSNQANFASIGGGQSNVVSGIHGAVGGGVLNRASGSAATVAGGLVNTAGGTYATVGGGRFNSALAFVSSVNGGQGNFIQTDADHSVIGGGLNNLINGLSYRGVIAGGGGNTIGVFSDYGTISGGQENDIAGDSFYTTIGGGYDNNIGASAEYSFIGGGTNNTIADNSGYSSIGGGRQNAANSGYSVIGGGSFHTISANSAHSTIGGGWANSIRDGSYYSTIAGGQSNDIDTNSYNSTVGGGFNNNIGTNSTFTVIAGGQNNNIGASSAYATIPGGDRNFATNRAFAAGTRAKANHTGAFVWGDSQNADFASTGANQFLIRAGGGMGVNVAQPRGDLHVGTSSNVPPLSLATRTILIDNAAQNGRAAFLALAGPGGSAATNRVEVQLEANESQRGGIVGTTSNHEMVFRQNNVTRMRLATNGNVGINVGLPTEQLHVNGNILATGTITPNSDRRAKTDVKPVDPAAVLERVAKLPVQQWRFKAEPDQVKHFGPMAQDFYAAFGLGSHETAIATVDADGVALAAIQGLNQKVEEQRSELKQKETEITELKRELAELKNQMNSIHQQLTGGTR